LAIPGRLDTPLDTTARRVARHCACPRLTSYDERASGTSAKGVEWKLYEDACVDEAGDPVDAELKTFQDAGKLVGKLVEFEVERQDDERYGTSYLLELPRRGGGSNRGGGLKDSVD
jgi:hypothetical protein